MKMMSSFLLSLILIAPLATGTTVSISLWAYDQYPGNSPYYSHYRLFTNSDLSVATIDHYDRGWGHSTAGNSSYHVMASINDAYADSGIERAVGWHQLTFSYDYSTKLISLFRDGALIRSGTAANAPEKFQFAFHNYFGGTQETVIDDFECRIDDVLVYQQGFESPTLDLMWAIQRLDGGTYISSGDPSTPHSGTGALAIGATTGGNLFSEISFNLPAVPEPSLYLLGLMGTPLLATRRRK